MDDHRRDRDHRPRVRRFTTDIDAAIRGDAIRAGELIETLEKHDITPGMQDALSFARTHLVLLVRHDLAAPRSWRRWRTLPSYSMRST